MIGNKKKRSLRAVFSMACIVTIASVNTPVYAEPSTQELESKTTEKQGELDSLNNELSSLCRELDDISAKIGEMAQQVEKAKLDLAAAQLGETLQYDAMKDRIKFMYEGGSASLLEILFSSANMADFLNKAEYVTTISEYDRKMLDELRKARNNVEAKQADLTKQQSELAAMQTELEKKEEALNSKISATSSDLANYSEQLERAKAAEAALKAAREKEAADRAAAEAAAAAQNNTVNNNVTNGDGSGTVTVDPTPSNVNETVLFAAILECEAGGSYDGMLAVATVIMNRVASPRYPGSITDVVYQSGQFAPTWDGSLNRVLAKGPSGAAYSAAQDALNGARHSAVLNCYQFRAAWTGVSGVNVGGNVFF